MATRRRCWGTPMVQQGLKFTRFQDASNHSLQPPPKTKDVVDPNDAIIRLGFHRQRLVDRGISANALRMKWCDIHTVTFVPRSWELETETHKKNKSPLTVLRKAVMSTSRSPPPKTKKIDQYNNIRCISFSRVLDRSTQ